MSKNNVSVIILAIDLVDPGVMFYEHAHKRSRLP